jgi:dGTPase
LERLTAVFASRPQESRGRRHPEPESPPRSCFGRDRDRILHSTAFRRLKHKTQVFIYDEGDHYRTRLTHTLEVSQIARSFARGLGLNEDLTEALALAHDLGHTPFGHAGERELDLLMQAHGGFDHNAQSLRLVTQLERKYASFDGLNLTWETLEGLVKHNGPLIDRQGSAIGKYAGRGVPPSIIDYSEAHDLELSTFGSAEAQCAAIADDVAYNAHDIDDGLRAQLFNVFDLADLPIVGEALSEVLRLYPDVERPRLIHETVRRTIAAMARDVIGQAQANFSDARPKSAADVRKLDRPMVTFSARMNDANRDLQRFLTLRMYQHPKVLEIMHRAQRIIRDLYAAYIEKPDLLPVDWRDEIGTSGGPLHAQQVCDFLAGMTDRYAIDQHRQLFDLSPVSI